MEGLSFVWEIHLPVGFAGEIAGETYVAANATDLGGSERLGARHEGYCPTKRGAIWNPLESSKSRRVAMGWGPGVECFSDLAQKRSFFFIKTFGKNFYCMEICWGMIDLFMVLNLEILLSSEVWKDLHDSSHPFLLLDI